MAMEHGDPDADALVDQTCELLRAYVREHPHAADTADGIARWWFPDPGPWVPPAVLERALQRLCDEGVLANRVQPSGRALWFVPPPAVE